MEVDDDVGTWLAWMGAAGPAHRPFLAWPPHPASVPVLPGLISPHSGRRGPIAGAPLEIQWPPRIPVPGARHIASDHRTGHRPPLDMDMAIGEGTGVFKTLCGPALFLLDPTGFPSFIPWCLACCVKKRSICERCVYINCRRDFAVHETCFSFFFPPRHLDSVVATDPHPSLPPRRTPSQRHTSTLTNEKHTQPTEPPTEPARSSIFLGLGILDTPVKHPPSPPKLFLVFSLPTLPLT